MNRVASMSALVIIALTLAEVWGDWRAMCIVFGIQLGMLAMNTWITLVLIRRGLRLAETVRTVGNSVGIVIIAMTTGFPIATWLWIPYAALSFDHVSPRTAGQLLAAFAAILDGLAIYQGIPWIYPAIFNAFAVVCLLISRARFTVIHGMLRRSDLQRHALERAHRGLAVAHEQLVAEVRAREQIELELRQAQKLEAIGRLAAGIAHEINTPVQFVSDSIHFVDEATRDLLVLVAKSRLNLEALVLGTSISQAVAVMVQAEEDADLPYVVEQLPAAMARVADGLGRITAIVRSMKEFAHPDLQQAAPADLNRALLATITIAAHEYKLVADVDFVPGDLPAVHCRAGELNQVFLNLVVNAAHAIGDVVQQSGKKGRITITTRTDGEHVVIDVADTGAGIPEAIRDRIFDPFFTTKEVGRGTGQGLAIARNVINHHGGTLTFDSRAGGGTTFAVRLPILAAIASPVPAFALSTRSSGSRRPTPAG